MSNNRACGGSVYYIREPNGALIARVVGTVLDATTTRYYHFDALGSTRMLTDKDGVVTDTYSYDAWGNTTHTGDTEQPYQHVGQLGYYSHYQDENLFSQNGYQFQQLGVRFYDALAGRFTQRDPVPTMMSEYPYCRNQPTIRIDPDGRKSKTEGEIKDIIDNMKATGQIMDTAKWCRLVFNKAFDNIVFDDKRGDFKNPGWKFLSKHCPDLTKGDIECTNETKWKPQCVNCLHKLKGLMTIEETIREWFDIYGDIIKIVVKKAR